MRSAISKKIENKMSCNYLIFSKFPPPPPPERLGFEFFIRTKSFSFFINRKGVSPYFLVPPHLMMMGNFSITHFQHVRYE